MPSARVRRGRGTSVRVVLLVCAAASRARAQASSPGDEAEAWSARGGPQLTLDARSQVSVMRTPTRSFPATGTCATGAGTAPVSIYGLSASENGAGAGGGLGAGAGYAYMSFPRPAIGSTWWALGAASRLDFELLQGRSPREPAPAGGEPCATAQTKAPDVPVENATFVLLHAPIGLGGQLGIGSYREPFVWRGLVLGAAWAPSYTWIKPSNGDATGAITFLGAEVTVDFATIDARKKRVPEPSLRAAAWFVAPVRADDPLVATISIGAVWY